MKTNQSKVAIVTGSSRGIGAAIAKRLASDGLQDQGRAVEHSQLETAARKQAHVFANRFSRERSFLEKEKDRPCRHPGHKLDAACRASEHQERAEIVILGLPSQQASFLSPLPACPASSRVSIRKIHGIGRPFSLFLQS